MTLFIDRRTIVSNIVRKQCSECRVHFTPEMSLVFVFEAQEIKGPWSHCLSLEILSFCGSLLSEGYTGHEDTCT